MSLNSFVIFLASRGARFIVEDSDSRFFASFIKCFSKVFVVVVCVRIVVAFIIYLLFFCFLFCFDATNKQT